MDKKKYILDQTKQDDSFLDNDIPYLYPHIRVVVLVKNKIFLVPNNDLYNLYGEKKMYYPFTGDIFYEESPKVGANRLIQEIIGRKLELRDLLDGPFLWPERKRLVFLFLALLDTVDVFRNTTIEGGELWTILGIKNALFTKKFSSCLVDELDFLEKVVFPIHKLMVDEKHDNCSRSYGFR